MRYQTRTRVRFGHSDPAGIVYYPRFFEWFHDAFESMFEHVLGIDYATILRERRVGFPAVQVACEFKRPAQFGAQVDLELFLSRLGERSATFEYRIRGEAGLLVTGSVKVAAMDLDHRTSVSIPQDLRSAWAPYVEVDQEGPETARLR